MSQLYVSKTSLLDYGRLLNVLVGRRTIGVMVNGMNHTCAMAGEKREKVMDTLAVVLLISIAWALGLTVILSLCYVAGEADAEDERRWAAMHTHEGGNPEAA
jgi:hypothetical protein